MTISARERAQARLKGILRPVSSMHPAASAHQVHALHRSVCLVVRTCAQHSHKVLPAGQSVLQGGSAMGAAQEPACTGRGCSLAGMPALVRVGHDMAIPAAQDVAGIGRVGQDAAGVLQLPSL